MENKVREAYLINKLESKDEKIQELKSDIHDLEQENKELKEQIKKLEAKNKDLSEWYKSTELERPELIELNILKIQNSKRIDRSFQDE